jgi:hypothetical protein
MTGTIVRLGDATAPVRRGVFAMPQRGKAFTFCTEEHSFGVDVKSVEDENGNRLIPQLGGGLPPVFCISADDRGYCSRYRIELVTFPREEIERIYSRAYEREREAKRLANIAARAAEQRREIAARDKRLAKTRARTK